MDTRADEFDQFTKLMHELSDGQQQLSKKDEEVLQQISTLQKDWDYVIETTDREFKRSVFKSNISNA